MTVEEAKAIAQAGELEITTHAPEELVVSVDQNATGTLLSCDGDRNYMWAGGTIVTLTQDADVTEIINDIHSDYAGRDGWTARREESAQGAPLVILDGPNQDGYLAGGDAEQSTIEIHSYSPCFHLPDGQSPRGDF